MSRLKKSEADDASEIGKAYDYHTMLKKRLDHHYEVVKPLKKLNTMIPVAQTGSLLE